MNHKNPTPEERLKVYLEMKEFIFHKRRNGFGQINLMVAFLKATEAKRTILQFRELKKPLEKLGASLNSEKAIDVINSCIKKSKRRVSRRKSLWFIYG